MIHDIETLNYYQSSAVDTAIYPKKAELEYLTLGLSGEAGEIANKVKKILRGDKEFDEVAKKDLAAELGDVLWYLAVLADALDVRLSQVATDNIRKLMDRKERNVLKGSGDNR